MNSIRGVAEVKAHPTTLTRARVSRGRILMHCQRNPRNSLTSVTPSPRKSANQALGTSFCGGHRQFSFHRVVVGLRIGVCAGVGLASDSLAGRMFDEAQQLRLSLRDESLEIV